MIESDSVTDSQPELISRTKPRTCTRSALTVLYQSSIELELELDYGCARANVNHLVGIWYRWNEQRAASSVNDER